MGIIRETFIAVVAGLIGSAILYLITLFANFLGWQDPFSVLFAELPLWTTVLTVLIIASLVYTVRGRRRGIYAEVIRKRPRYDVLEGIYHYFGVDWHFLHGTYSLNSDYYVFCEPSPLCPDCECELESPRKGGLLRRYYWKCERCGRTYKCAKNHIFDANDVVQKIVESDISTGRMKLPRS